MRVYVLILFLGVAARAHAIGLCTSDADCTGGICAATCFRGLCTNDPAAKKGRLCRPASGVCDRAEVCDGVNADCPVDAVLPAGTVCRAAANDCDVAEKCSGRSKDCPADSFAPAGTACENVNACVTGGTCSGPVCIGGQPELTFAPDPAEFPQGVREVDVLVEHTGPGAPIEVSGARIDTTGAFVLSNMPPLPASLATGEQVHLTLRLDPNVTVGDHSATLLVQATSCADQPLHLHAAVTNPGSPDAGSGSPDAGSGSPDAGSGSPDAGSGSPDAGSGPVGSSGSSSADSGKSGGCSSGPASVEMLALAGLAAAALSRRRRPAA